VKEYPVKRTVALIGSMVLIAALADPLVVVAQQKLAPVPLKVQLVVSRHAGDKKISSLPYTLWVTANEQRTTYVRMGVQVPVPTTMITKEGVTTPSYNYRDVGTNIDCQAVGPTDGFFSLQIKVNDSSVSFDAKDSTPALKGIPAFRNFTGDFHILLKDGQTAQYASATDPVTGETLRVEATINVLK
jgi:hypothetical protein